MYKFGLYILGNRLQAIFVTSIFSMLGLLVPVFSYIMAGTPPGLVTLRKGPKAGIQVIFGSLFITMLLALLVKFNPYIVIAFAIGIWLPIWCCANVLRISQSQGYLVLAAGAFALLYILLSHLILDDITQWWRSWLEIWLQQAMQEASKVQLKEILDNAAPLMNAMTAAGFFLSLVTALLISRWWQSMMFNPGGFRKEFHLLCLPRWLITAVLAGLILVVMDKAAPGSMVMDILVLLIFVYLFQGLATIHRIVAEKKLARSWLVFMYLFMFIVPQVILFLACLGMADSWLVKSKTDFKNDNF